MSLRPATNSNRDALFLLSAAVLATGLGVLGLHRKHTNIAALTASNEHYGELISRYSSATKVLIEDLLRDLVRECQLFNENADLKADTRISMYCHDGKSSLIPVVRHSGNPKFEIQRSVIYPDDEGIIGKAWQEGFARYQCQDSSGIFSRGSSSDDSWVDEQCELFSFTRKRAASITMRSTSMMAFRITFREKKLGWWFSKAPQSRG